ncbi:MAG: HAMP domain-containing sensor histidine kinase, partial [Syntrophomonadaceae bacterium]|nr:HAMP domain-containing sensor histidine kinase [Syntrophomonadaceae bacterium]
LSCENGCNMGPGCINHDKSLDMVEQSIAVRSEACAGNPEAERILQVFLKDILGKRDFSYRYYEDLSSHNTIKTPSVEEIQAIYRAMHKEEEKDFRNCATCGYNSCYKMAVAIFNGLNKGENCHLYQEKELLLEQKILNDMVAELEALNSQLEEEFHERKQQEQLLIQNSKLAAMGEMIGMIAHQWRQPLSSISTLAANLQVFLELEMFEQEQFMQLLKEINSHAQYLSATINDFRHFFKPDNPQDMVVLSKVVENTLGIMGKSLEYKNVTLQKHYSFTTPILTYPNELIQVFLNILKNASDAFVENEIQKPLIVIRGGEQADHHLLEVEDNAGGIPADILDKIFEPYFSTKGAGVGTGLGLYMCKMIVEEHCRGELKATNTGKGACFTIKLPVHQEEIE